jgi:hypothetical protein
MTLGDSSRRVDHPARRVGPFRLKFFSALGRAFEKAALVGGTSFALVYWMRLPYRLPGPEDYQAAQHALLDAARPGDAVAVLPFWADRAKIYLHGLPVVALPHLAEEDVERYQRLFVLSQPDLPRSSATRELAGLERKLARVFGPKRYGPLSLSLLRPRPGREPSLDFTSQIERASVSVGGEACTPGSGTFQCPRGPWDQVRSEWHEFDFLPRRCVRAQPTQGDTVSVTFDQVPLRAEIHGAMGLVGAGGTSGLGRVELSIDLDGAPALALVQTTGDPGFHKFEARFPGLEPGGHRVTFRINSAGPVQQPFCFDAVAY